MQTAQNDKPQQNEEQEQPGRTPPDPELHAMKRIRAILAELPVGARGRVLAYVVDRAQEERFAGNPIGRTFTDWEQARTTELAQAMAPLADKPLAR